MMKYHNTSNKSIVRVALVTASSAGLGAATAKVLASEGFSVVINYLASKDKADRVVSDIEILQEDALEMTASMVPADITAETQVDADATTPAGPVSDSDSNSLHGGGGDQANHGRRVLAVQADMSKREDIQHVISTTITHFGRLDVVVSNQGWTCMRDFSDLDDNMVESDWDTCFNINVKSHLYLFHAAQPYLVATRGSFVSVASLAGVVPSGSSIPYSVTKAAQIHLMKSLAKISGPEIRVNSVSPGIMLTEWGQKFPQDKLNAATQRSVLNKLADIDDVVKQIVLLATTRSVTGQNVVIDAGWSSA